MHETHQLECERPAGLPDPRLCRQLCRAGRRRLFGTGDQDAAGPGGFCAGRLHRIYLLGGEKGLQRHGLLVQIHAGFAILLWPASFVLPNALRAANDVKFTMMTSILSMAIWRLGFSYLIGVHMGLGAIGVWIAMVVDWVCRVVCFVLRFRSGVWKTKYIA